MEQGGEKQKDRSFSLEKAVKSCSVVSLAGNDNVQILKRNSSNVPLYSPKVEGLKVAEAEAKTSPLFVHIMHLFVRSSLKFTVFNTSFLIHIYSHPN